MIRSLIDFSIRFRGVIIALACVLTGYGIYVLNNAKYDVYPEFAPPEVVVQTEAPGLSSEQVEALVTQPIENTLNGVASKIQARKSAHSRPIGSRNARNRLPLRSSNTGRRTQETVEM